jgi:hypothetical protein
VKKTAKRKTSRKPNAQDLTLRNLRAIKKRLVSVEVRLSLLEAQAQSLDDRVTALAWLPASAPPVPLLPLREQPLRPRT